MFDRPCRAPFSSPWPFSLLKAGGALARETNVPPAKKIEKGDGEENVRVPKDCFSVKYLFEENLIALERLTISRRNNFQEQFSRCVF